jgi:hypothetical protein
MACLSCSRRITGKQEVRSYRFEERASVEQSDCFLMVAQRKSFTNSLRKGGVETVLLEQSAKQHAPGVRDLIGAHFARKERKVERNKGQRYSNSYCKFFLGLYIHSHLLRSHPRNNVTRHIATCAVGDSRKLSSTGAVQQANRVISNESIFYDGSGAILGELTMRFRRDSGKVLRR